MCYRDFLGPRRKLRSTHTTHGKRSVARRDDGDSASDECVSQYLNGKKVCAHSCAYVGRSAVESP
jgi:hypothetical protein